MIKANLKEYSLNAHNYINKYPKLLRGVIYEYKYIVVNNSQTFIQRSSTVLGKNVTCTAILKKQTVHKTV